MKAKNLIPGRIYLTPSNCEFLVTQIDKISPERWRLVSVLVYSLTEDYVSPEQELNLRETE